MPSELENAIARGAEVTQIAKLVEVSGLGVIVDQLKDIATVQQIAYIEQNKILVNAIDRLVDVITEKEMDTSGLIEAISSLKMEATLNHEPHNWQIDFERDQRSLMKSGITLKALPRVLNS